MNNLWGGAIADAARQLNSSIGVDCRMWREDIAGSLAHAAMLAKQGIISQADGEAIQAGLLGILEDVESGKLAIDMSAEDIHTFVEMTLTERIGDAGKRLHTARSRNDQVATDLRLYTRGQIDELLTLLYDAVAAIRDKAAAYKDAVMPGYTHLQRAQPVTLGHYLCAWAMMLTRDAGRLADAKKRLNQCPLGACALAGTSFPIDRDMTAKALVQPGVRVRHPAGGVRHRLVHHAPEKEPGHGRAHKGQDRPGVRGPDGAADGAQGAAPGLQQGHAGG